MLHQDTETTLFFQSFEDCPIANEDKIASATRSSLANRYLLGAIQLEATLSTSPTYICKDIKGNLFAVTIRLPTDEIQENVRGGGFDVTAWKRGWCLAILGAKRSGVKDGKQGYVVVNKADLMVFPTSLQRLINIYQTFKDQNNLPSEHRACLSCGSGENLDKLKACLGCGAAWYCQKECQMRGWNEKGHKKECKVFRTLKKLSPVQSLDT